MAVSAVFTTTGSQTWNWPAGVTSVLAEALGGGGGSGTASGNPATGGGGKGGSFASATITKGADTQLTIVVGAGGALASAGAASTVVQGGTTRVSAAGGGGGATQAASSANGAGGTTLNGANTGTTTFAGGNGGTGNFTAGTQGSGAGGGAAGPTSVGGAANVNTAGGAGTGTWGNGQTYQVAGAAGVGNTTPGVAGSNYGAGASGGKANSGADQNGAAGAQGIVVLTWTPPDQAVTGVTLAAASVVNEPVVVLQVQGATRTSLTVLNAASIAPGPVAVSGATLAATALTAPAVSGGSGGGTGPVVFVNRAVYAPNGSGSAFGTFTCPATDHTAGNALFVMVGLASGVTATVSDTAGNIFNLVAYVNDGTAYFGIWEAHNITGHSANVVQAVLSAGIIYPWMIVHQVSGFGSGAPIHAESCILGSTTSTDANGLTSALSFSGESYFMGLINASYASGTAPTHSGVTFYEYGEASGDVFPYFKEFWHVVTTSPHQCGVLLGGVGVSYHALGAVFTPVGGGGPFNQTIAGPSIASGNIKYSPTVSGGAITAGWDATPLAQVATVLGPNGGMSGQIDTRTANFIAIHVAWYPGGAVPDVAVSDTMGNTWVPLSKGTSQNIAGQVWYCANPVTASGHGFFATGTQTYPSIQVTAWKTGAAAPYDARTIIGVTVSPATPSAVTPAQPGSLLLATIAHETNGGFTPTIGSGFTVGPMSPYTSAQAEGGAQAYLVQGAVAPVTASWAYLASGTGGAVASLTAFAPAPPATGDQAITTGTIASSTGLLGPRIVSFWKLVKYLHFDTNGTGTSPAIDTTGVDLIVIHRGYDASASVTVTDSYGNTWVWPAGTTKGGTAADLGYARPPNASFVGAGHTFTFTGGTKVNADILCFAGSQPSPKDGSNDSLATGTSVSVALSPSPSVDNELILSGLAWSPVASVPNAYPSGGYDVYVTGLTASRVGTGVVWLEQQTAAAYTAAWGVSGSNDLVTTVISFKLAVVTGTSVAGATITSGAQLFAATVTPQAVTITSGTRASTLAMNVPTLAAQTTGATIVSGSATFAPSVLQTVTTGTRASTLVLNAATVAAALTSATIASSSIAFALAVTQTVTTGTRPTTLQLFAASVAPGAVTLTGATLASTAALAAPTLAVGAVAVTGATRSSTAVLFAAALAAQTTGATIGPGAVFAPALAGAVTSPTVSATSTLTPPTVVQPGVGAITTGTITGGSRFAPTVLPQPVTVTGGPIAATFQAFAPIVSLAGVVNIGTGTIGPVMTAFAPSSLVPGPVSVTAATRPTTTQIFAPVMIASVTSADTIPIRTLLFAPSLSATMTAVGGLLAVQTLFAPALAVHQAVSNGFIVADNQTFAPTVSAGTVAVIGATRGSTAQLFALTVLPSGALGGPTTGPATQLFSLAVSAGAVTLSGATVSATSGLTAPTLAPLVGVGFIGPGQMFAATVTAGPRALGGTTILSTAQFFAPDLTVGATTVVSAAAITTTQLFPTTLVARLDGAFRTSTAVLFGPGVAPVVGVIVVGGLPSHLVLFGPAVAKAAVDMPPEIHEFVVEVVTSEDALVALASDVSLTASLARDTVAAVEVVTEMAVTVSVETEFETSAEAHPVQIAVER